MKNFFSAGRRFPRLLAALCFATSLLPAAPGWSDRVLLDRVVAVVNGEVITWSQLRGFIPPDAMAEARAPGGERADREVRRLESKYLEEMVELRLEAQAAEAEGISVSEAEVDQAVQGIRAKFSLSDEAFARALEEQGLTLESYRANLREQILVNRVVNKVIRPRVTVSDSEVDPVMALEHPEFAHRNIAARVRLISLEEDGEKGTETVRQIIREYNEGTPFSDLASRYSTDPSAKFGGDLGVIRRGMVKPALESAAFSLEPGKISDPLYLDGRLYLLLVESYEEQSGDIARARREITERLREKGMEREYRAWLRQLKGKAYVDIKLN